MNRKKNPAELAAIADEQLARQYETKDPALAALLRIPEEFRTADQEHAIAAWLTGWERREQTYMPTVFAP